MLTLVAGAAFLVRAGRFRLPALSLPGLAIVATAIAWLAWRARRGSATARRLEAGILVVWGCSLLLSPTSFDGWSLALTRSAGLGLACWGAWLLARLVRDEVRRSRS